MKGFYEDYGRKEESAKLSELTTRSAMKTSRRHRLKIMKPVKISDRFFESKTAACLHIGLDPHSQTCLNNYLKKGELPDGRKVRYATRGEYLASNN